jgi:Glyoxalase/Bleomycin resistance protein/Dioxygenase superfamily
MQPFYQVGVLVEDIEAAMTELSSALGCTWGKVTNPTVDGWSIRVVFSVEGPPHIELIEGVPGSPWDTSSGSRIDHIGFWSDDLDASADRAISGGLPLSKDADGRVVNLPFVYHDARASGMRVEFIDASTREGFYQRIGAARNGGGAVAPETAGDETDATSGADSSSHRNPGGS